MEERSKDEEEIRQYLIGEIPESELEKIERRLITDQEYFRQVELTEGELADEYVRGGLSTKEREGFEKKFLTNNESLDEVRLAAGLRKFAQQEGGRSSSDSANQTVEILPVKQAPGNYWSSKLPVERYMLAAATLAFLVVITVSAIRIFKLQNELARTKEQINPGMREQALEEELAQERAQAGQLKEALRIEQDQRRNLEQQLAVLKGSDSPANSNTSAPDRRPTFPAIVLASRSTRGGGERKRAVIEPGMESLQVELVLRTKAYDTYKAVLQDETGKDLQVFEPLKPKQVAGSNRVSLKIPTSILPGGDYVLRLSGAASQSDFEETGSYYFRVIKQ
jgi:hypothetical protein